MDRYTASTVRCKVGEGPLWNPHDQSLYVTDIFAGIVYAFDELLSVRGVLRIGRPTSAFTIQSDGSLVLFHDDGAIGTYSGKSREYAEVHRIPSEVGGLFNDVIADPTGRVLCGAQPIGGRPGRLYCLERDLSWRILLDDVVEPNGLAFSLDNRILYFADSGAQVVWRMSYDSDLGTVSDRRVFARTDGAEHPDGITVDVEGCIWCALWGGGRLIRINAEGHVVKSIALPAMKTTSLTFGGRDFEILYATSAQPRADEHASGNAEGLADGAIYRMPGCGRGRPEFASRLRVKGDLSANTCAGVSL
jgi:D-xylono/L-arabinono-1,4-lactonase